MRQVIFILEALALLLGLVQSASGQSMEIWSYEVPGNGPRHAHVWARFFSADKAETVVISFGPIGQTRFLKRAEPGRNYSHEASLGFAKAFGAEVRMLGPFPCSERLHASAKRRKAALENGLVEYKAVALVFGPWRSNCVIAVAGVGRGHFVEGVTYGHEAARRVARHLIGQ